MFEDVSGLFLVLKPFNQLRFCQLAKVRPGVSKTGVKLSFNLLVNKILAAVEQWHFCLILSDFWAHFAVINYKWTEEALNFRINCRAIMTASSPWWIQTCRHCRLLPVSFSPKVHSPTSRQECQVRQIASEINRLDRPLIHHKCSTATTNVLQVSNPTRFNCQWTCSRTKAVRIACLESDKPVNSQAQLRDQISTTFYW